MTPEHDNTANPADSYPWKRNSPIHRWYALGRYYAMFPPSFAYNAVCGLTRPGEHVLDPFCGRGNGPFSATVLNRPATGIDINPVAWLYTAAKLHPEPKLDQVLERLKEIDKASRPKDRKSRSRFETMLWSPRVRAFLRAARRELKWEPGASATDRTLMAFVALICKTRRGPAFQMFSGLPSPAHLDMQSSGGLERISSSRPM